MDFGFMWFPNDKKLPPDVEEKFCNMVAYVKAVFIAPPQMKTMRESTPRSGDLLILKGSTPNSTPSEILERHWRGASKGNKSPTTTKEVPMKDLLHMHNNSRIYPNKLDIINQAIYNHLEPLYVWSCQPLDNANKQRVKVPLQHLHCAPCTWVHTQVT